jgi:cell division inhibitor SepF
MAANHFRDSVRATSQDQAETIATTSHKRRSFGMLSQMREEVVILKPSAFADMHQAIQLLRDQKIVILNLSLMQPSKAQRFIDFVSGGTVASDGHAVHLGEQTFLFAPGWMQISDLMGVSHPATRQKAEAT